MGKLEDLILRQDIYGHAVGVHYRGSGSYQTRLGALCTLITYMFIILNLVTVMSAFKDGSNQKENMQTMMVDNLGGDNYKLQEKNFMMSFSSWPPIPENIGRFKYIQWEN